MRRPHLRRSEPSATPVAAEPPASDSLCSRQRQPRPTLVAGSLFGLALGEEERQAALGDDQQSPPSPAAAHAAGAFCWGRTRVGEQP
ncbi:MAG: hypothetical protein M3083_08750 [Actinomycetota bacterium]|nr:hypothetical protein [Actinomycetota bacterium]